MDVIVIILVLVALAVMIFKKFSSFVYYVAIVDIFLRLVAFLASHLPIPVVTNFLATYFPDSVADIIRIYSSGILKPYYYGYYLFYIACLNIM